MSQKNLEIDSPAEEKIAALRSAAKHFNADLTYIICRDLKGRITEVSVCAGGSYAGPLARYLKQLQKVEDSRSAHKKAARV